MPDTNAKNLDNSKQNEVHKKHSFFGGEINAKTKDLLDFRYNTQEEIDKLNEEMKTNDNVRDEKGENFDDKNSKYFESDFHGSEDLHTNNYKNDDYLKNSENENGPIEGEVVENIDSKENDNKDIELDNYDPNNHNNDENIDVVNNKIEGESTVEEGNPKFFDPFELEFDNSENVEVNENGVKIEGDDNMFDPFMEKKNEKQIENSDDDISRQNSDAGELDNENSKISNENEETFDENEETFDENEETFDENEETFDENEETIDENEETIDENEETFDENGESIDENEESIDENEESIDENGESIDENEESIDENEENIDENEENIDENEENIDEDEESIDEKGEYKEVEQENSGDIGQNVSANIDQNIKNKDYLEKKQKDRKEKRYSANGQEITEDEIQLEQGQDMPNSEDEEEYQPSAEELFEWEPEFFADDELSQQFMHLIMNVRGIFKLERKDGEQNPYFKILGGKTEASMLEYLFYLIEEEGEPIDLYIKKIEMNMESGEEVEHLVQFSYNEYKELNIFVDEVILYEKINKSEPDSLGYSDTKAILEKFIFLTENYYDKLKSEFDRQNEERRKKKQLQQIFKGF